MTEDINNDSQGIQPNGHDDGLGTSLTMYARTKTPRELLRKQPRRVSPIALLNNQTPVNAVAKTDSQLLSPPSTNATSVVSHEAAHPLPSTPYDPSPLPVLSEANKNNDKAGVKNNNSAQTHEITDWSIVQTTPSPLPLTTNTAPRPSNPLEDHVTKASNPTCASAMDTPARFVSQQDAATYDLSVATTEVLHLPESDSPTKVKPVDHSLALLDRKKLSFEASLEACRKTRSSTKTAKKKRTNKSAAKTTTKKNDKKDPPAAKYKIVPTTDLLARKKLLHESRRARDAEADDDNTTVGVKAEDTSTVKTTVDGTMMTSEEGGLAKVEQTSTAVDLTTPPQQRRQSHLASIILPATPSKQEQAEHRGSTFISATRPDTRIIPLGGSKHGVDVTTGIVLRRFGSASETGNVAKANFVKLWDPQGPLWGPGHHVSLVCCSRACASFDYLLSVALFSCLGFISYDPSNHSHMLFLWPTDVD